MGGHITRSCCPAEAQLTDVASVEERIVAVDGSAGRRSCSSGIATGGHITCSCPPAVALLTDVALVEGRIAAVDGSAGSPSHASGIATGWHVTGSCPPKAAMGGIATGCPTKAGMIPHVR
jgi:hypothetical protein